MERFAYLTLSLSTFLVCIILLIARRDLLSSRAIKYSLAGVIAGPLAEVFYFRDYWRPLTSVGLAKISPEDFIMGLSITLLGIIILPFLTKSKFSPTGKPKKKKLYLMFVVTEFGALFILNIWLGINSVLVSSTFLILFVAIMLFMRRDLIKPALYSLVAVTCLIVFYYIIIFVYLAPHFWDRYWLLKDTRWGITILGHIPLSEIYWYITWAVFASISYPFAGAKKLEKLRSPN
jgi:hypothetical protein